MKKRLPKKLELSRETLRSLAEDSACARSPAGARTPAL